MTKTILKINHKEEQKRILEETEDQRSVVVVIANKKTKRFGHVIRQNCIRNKLEGTILDNRKIKP